jgi:hypothetical protein
MAGRRGTVAIVVWDALKGVWLGGGGIPLPLLTPLSPVSCPDPLSHCSLSTFLDLAHNWPPLSPLDVLFFFLFLRWTQAST